MAYATGNPKTKKALKEAVAAGKEVRVYNPSGGPVALNGREYLEGPHYPEMHKWYATAEVRDGVIVKVT